MSDAPERIWATTMDPSVARSGTFVDLVDYPTKPNRDAIEYTRADVANALVAAALREAADIARDPTAHYAVFPREVADAIRALITHDASAALDKLLAEARREGVERAAEIFAEHPPDQFARCNASWRHAVYDAILAEIRDNGQPTKRDLKAEKGAIERAIDRQPNATKAYLSGKFRAATGESE